MITIKEMLAQLENDFTAEGKFVSLDKDDWKDHVAPEIYEAYENGTLIPDYEDNYSIEFCIEDIAKAACEAKGFELIDYVIDQVFESPGLDIYVATITIANKDGTETLTSYHNIYEYC